MKRFSLCVMLVTACSSSGTTIDGGADVQQVVDSGGAETGTDAAPNPCSAAIGQVLKPIDMVSTGDVTIINEAGGVRTLYVDASAGGVSQADTSPRIYVDLTAGKRVDITDVQARTSTAWDLALKRYVIFTNSGTGGPGMGGTLVVKKAFDQVTSSDATGTFAIEAFVDKDCNPTMDPLGGFVTTMSDWYAYDMQTMAVTPKGNTTYVIKGASGKLFKLAILQYYGLPDGGMGSSGGMFVLRTAAL
jgi:hypothetical protein